MDKESQCKMILFYLKEYGSITPREALQLCECMRLAARIHDLRSKGIAIKTIPREYKSKTGHMVRYAEYRLEV